MKKIPDLASQSLARFSKFNIPIPPFSVLLAISAITLMMDLSVRGLFYSTAIVFLSSVLIFPQQTLGIYQKTERWLSANRARRTLLPLVSTVLIFSVFLLTSLAAPAHAQFFVQTEAWMKTVMAGAAGGGANNGALIALIFNVLRALFVLYLGIALVRVIVAARNDDDWTTLARTPLIIVVAVTLGDLLANYITGAGGAAPG